MNIKTIRQARSISRPDLAASLRAAVRTSGTEHEHLRTVAASSAATTRMREDLGLTQEQLAARSRVPVEFVRSLEAAKDVNPDVYSLYCLSYGLGVSFPTFWQRVEEFLPIGEDEE